MISDRSRATTVRISPEASVAFDLRHSDLIGVSKQRIPCERT
jgi:hypothetical protein